MRILSGIQPSGELHLGNYFAMMRPAIELQAQGEAYLFIADLHALTTSPDPALLRERIRHVAVDFLACGLDPARTVFFRHSEVPQIAELTWLLGCVTPMGLLERCHSFKDKTAKGIAPNFGLFAYPVLMAADILIYKSHVVPVGRDQKQHVEVTRDIAQRFNHAYGEIFVLPEPRIREEVAVVPGTDGQKMSKTYGNTIEIFGPEKAMRKKIMAVVTDCKGLEDPKDPETCNVFALYRLMASPAEQAEMAAKYRAGSFGYGHAKQALFEAYWEHFRPFRARRDELLADPGLVDRILAEGATKARAVAADTLGQARRAVGLA
jgi:tryptophanyl-tRNA synthetase